MNHYQQQRGTFYKALFLLLEYQPVVSQYERVWLFSTNHQTLMNKKSQERERHNPIDHDKPLWQTLFFLATKHNGSERDWSKHSRCNEQTVEYHCYVQHWNMVFFITYHTHSATSNNTAQAKSNNMKANKTSHTHLPTTMPLLYTTNDMNKNKGTIKDHSIHSVSYKCPHSKNQKKEPIKFSPLNPEFSRLNKIYISWID